MLEKKERRRRLRSNTFYKHHPLAVDLASVYSH